MKRIIIEDDAQTIITRHKDPSDCWSANSTDTSHCITGFRVVSDNSNYFDLTLDEIDPEHVYTLLYAIYSTGDSFSNHLGKIEFIDLFADEQLAYLNQTRIERVEAGLPKYVKQYGCNDGYSIKLLNSQGKEYTVSIPWRGYFEKLQGVYTQSVYLLNPDDLCTQ